MIYGSNQLFRFTWLVKLRAKVVTNLIVTILSSPSHCSVVVCVDMSSLLNKEFCKLKVSSLTSSTQSHIIICMDISPFLN